MATDECTYNNYLEAYRYFVREFVDKMNPRDQQDQLPVSVSAYDVTEHEIVGEIINVTLQYLNQTHCPPSLQGHLIHQVVQEMKAMCKKQPEDCGLKPEEKTYAPLKLMKAVTNKVSEICKCYLEQNKIDSLPPPSSTPLPMVGAQAIRNCRRKMEDRYAILHDLNTIFSIQNDSVANYYAVFDGHGGEDAAVYCATHLHRNLVESEYYPSDPERALSDAFLTTDAQFAEKFKTHNASGGTTAVCTLLLNRNLYVAWVGDSEAILVRDGQITSLVNPHRLSRLGEMQRIYSMGGYITHSMGVMRVNGMLNVSRAIGDLRYKPYVTAEPETKCVPLNGTEDFMIIASDGLWDSLPDTEVACIVYQEICRNPNTLKYALQRLLDCAKRVGSVDNITVILVLLAPIDEIASRARKAYSKYFVQKTSSQTQLKNDDQRDLLPSDASRRHDGTNGVFIKQIPQLVRGQEQQQEQEQRENGAAGQMDGNHTMYETSSNGEHENGDVDCDYSDLGPETDVDAIDDVAPAPVKKLYIVDLPDVAYGAGRKNKQLNKDERADTPDSSDSDSSSSDVDSDVPVNHGTERKSDGKPDDHNVDRIADRNINLNLNSNASLNAKCNIDLKEDRSADLNVDHILDHTVGQNIDLNVDRNVDLNADHIEDLNVDHNVDRILDHNEDLNADHSVERSVEGSVGHILDQDDEHNVHHVFDRSEEHSENPDEEHSLDDDLDHHLERNFDRCVDADESYIENKFHAVDEENGINDAVDADDRVSLKDETHTDEQLEGTRMEETRGSTDVHHDDTHDVVDDAMPVDYDESLPSPQATKPLQHALIPEADNVADSEDSEDEWNFYRIDPNKEKVPTAAPADDEPQDNQKENEAHRPEAQTVEDRQLEQLESPQVEQEVKCESPKEEASSELIDTEISAEDKLVEPKEEKVAFAEQKEDSVDMTFQLNPDAAEFIPVSPKILGPKLNLVEDFPISGSPLKQVSPMDDIQVPSQSEFDEEVCQRPREIETEQKDCTNGDYLERTDYKDFMADRQKGSGIPSSLDDSEISSTKAEFGDESASFITATEFQRTGISTVDESFSSTERYYDISDDPMAESFTSIDFGVTFHKNVDLNAVHDLSTVDLDDKNGTVEDTEDENNDTIEGDDATAADPSEMQTELATLTSEPKLPESEPESEKPAVTATSFTCAFASEVQEEIQTQAQAPNSPFASSFQDYDETEATFIVHPEEPKKSEPSDTPLEEQVLIEPAEQQEIVKSEPSPLTDFTIESFSLKFESEKELVSVEDEQPLLTCSLGTDETKPIEEPSEDAVLPTSETQKDLCVQDSDTPFSVSPVPNTIEYTPSQLKDEALSSPMENIHISPMPSAFALQPDALAFTTAQYVTETLSPEPAFTTAAIPSDLRSSPIEDQQEEKEESPVDEILKPISTAEPIQQEQAQEILLDFSMDQEVCTKGPVESMEGKTTPPPTPFEPSDMITHNLDDLMCPIQSSTMLEDTIVAKPEEPVKKLETYELEAAKEAPLIEMREPEIVQATPALNLSESMQEFTGLEKQLLPEEAAPIQYVVPESEPQAIKEEALEQKVLIEPAIKETNAVQHEKPISQDTPQLTSVDQQPVEQAVEATEKKTEEPTVVPIAVAAAAAATVTVVAATAAVTTQSKTKTKPAAKATKFTTATRTTSRSTPTSPSKTMTPTSRTSNLSAKKQMTAAGAARSKELDAQKKTALSGTANKTAASKPAAVPKPGTAMSKTTTRTNTATATRPKSAIASPKPSLGSAEKKPTANGDVKSLSKPAAAKSLSKPAATGSSSTGRTSLVKSSTSSSTARTSSGGTTTTAKTKPTSGVTSSTKTSTRTSTTGNAIARQKITAPATSTTAKPRATTSTKSPMIDKQIKETANKQISLARSSTSTASKTTTRTSISSTSASTTIKRTSTSSKSTNVTSSTAKKGGTTTVSKVMPRGTSATKSTSTSGKAKVVQNGVSESMEINNTIITTTNSKLEDDVPKKDLSPVIAPTDNQLIMSSD